MGLWTLPALSWSGSSNQELFSPSRTRCPALWACFPEDVYVERPGVRSAPRPSLQAAVSGSRSATARVAAPTFLVTTADRTLGSAAATLPTPTKFKGNARASGILPWLPALPSSPRNPEAQVRCVAGLRGRLSLRREVPAGAHRHLVATGRPCGVWGQEESAQSRAQRPPRLPTWVAFQQARSPGRKAQPGGNTFAFWRALGPEGAAFSRGHGGATKALIPAWDPSWDLPGWVFPFILKFSVLSKSA